MRWALRALVTAHAASVATAVSQWRPPLTVSGSLLCEGHTAHVSVPTNHPRQALGLTGTPLAPRSGPT